MSVNPFFLDDAAGDYRLRSNSTLIGAGRDGGTVGALGIVSPKEESAVPSPVFIRAFPDTAYWTLLQGQAWLSVDIYIMVGNLVSFIPDEVEVRFFGEDGGIVVSERIPASDFRATSAAIETDVTNLWMVWDATLTELKSPTPLEVPPGGRSIFLPKEHPFPQADLPVRAEYVVRGQEGGRTVELVREVVPEIYRQRTDLRFPMRGGGWQVIAGPPQDNHRHRATTFRRRTLAMPGRYAMDIWRSYRGLYRTDGLTKEDYWGYGAPMYAPGVGRVVFVRNDADEPAFGEEIPGGESNTVVIDHQNCEYSFMLHLKRGSVAVEVGQWVEQGDLIGALGNSFDRWNVPHLHFEVRDSYIWPGEGLPVAFTGGRILGTEIQDGMLFSGAFFEKESLGPVLHVAADWSADYRTISDAMAVAVMGDTVRVAPGTYRETVWLKSGVVVLGSGYEGTRIEIDILANPVYAVNVSDAKISGFTLAYTGTESPVTVFVDSSQVTVANCRITNTTVSGVYAVNGSKVTVEGCLVEQNEGFGIAIYGGFGGVYLGQSDPG